MKLHLEVLVVITYLVSTAYSFVTLAPDNTTDLPETDPLVRAPRNAMVDLSSLTPPPKAPKVVRSDPEKRKLTHQNQAFKYTSSSVLQNVRSPNSPKCTFLDMECANPSKDCFTLMCYVDKVPVPNKGPIAEHED